jgi:hypothetical protein
MYPYNRYMVLITIPDPTDPNTILATEDQLRTWLHATLTPDPWNKIAFADLYTRYLDWCANSQTTPLSKRALGSRIQARRHKQGGHHYLLGARLT